MDSKEITFKLNRIELNLLPATLKQPNLATTSLSPSHLINKPCGRTVVRDYQRRNITSPPCGTIIKLPSLYQLYFLLLFCQTDVVNCPADPSAWCDNCWARAFGNQQGLTCLQVAQIALVLSLTLTDILLVTGDGKLIKKQKKKRNNLVGFATGKYENYLNSPQTVLWGQ